MRPLIGLLAALAIAPAQGAQPSDESPHKIHWAARLGARVEMVNRAFPVLDRVVLVPDAATYLKEISAWSDRGRWPVLIEDDRYAAMFIRRFQPAQVLRRAPAGELPQDPQRRRALITSAVVRAWGGDPGRQSIAEIFQRRGYTPPGIVITSTADPAWTAAVALAAGRGQPLAWLDEPLGRPNGVLEPQETARLRAGAEQALADCGYAYADLGDAIETLTLCRSMAGRANLGNDPDGKDVRAVTDILGRDPDGHRHAFAGWIFGSETRCAYAAMCSLFISRSRFWLYNTYPDVGGWTTYGIDGATAVLRNAGFAVTPFAGPATRAEAWLDMLPGGLAADVLVMNSKGNAGDFELADGRAYSGDVPVLSEPLALHLIHSWSLRSPENLSTVGGRWLDHGVYAYVGSVQEPNLSAFLPPSALVERWAAGVPFLVAARHWSETTPWKVNTFGDPLMLCRPAEGAPPRWPAPADDDGLDLREHAKALMRRAAADSTGEAFAGAIAVLSLLGEDEVARQLWLVAGRQGAEEAGATAALDPLFRRRDAEEFCRAWQAAPTRDDRAVTMLWQLMTPRLDRLTDRDILLLLQSVVRRDQSDADLERLAPYLTAAFGADHTKIVIQREIDKATGPRVRKRLQRLLQRQ